MLLAELRSQRRHVKTTLEGLSDAQRRAPVPPMTWGPIAVLHHLALDVERWWFQAVIDGDETAREFFDANPGGAWRVPSGVDVVALYDAECAASDAILARVDLAGVPAAWPQHFGPAQAIGEIVLHVVTETATHAGQLDIVRELIDGRQHLVLD
jgi:Protein of unknown function (DUF664)